MSVSVIICAAGKGERAGFSQNKVFEHYQGIPVLERTISAFLRDDVSQIIVAHAREDMPFLKYYQKRYPMITLVEGGETRMHTVYNALAAVTEEIVLIHDGARPFVSQDVIDRCIESVQKNGSGIAAIPAVDTICIAHESGGILSTPPRAQCYMVQTPQGFYTQGIRQAYADAFIHRGHYTDDSSVYGAYVDVPMLCEGDLTNRKLTYQSDFQPQDQHIGYGIDTHAFVNPSADRKQLTTFIKMCGVSVPSHSAVQAHSDGDVAIHALMDALLSAAGRRDIGHYFPDDDPDYKGADSMWMLREVMRLLRADGIRPSGVSIAIQAETPKMAKYILEMQKNVAEALHLPTHQVGITAGTNERLGYVGEGKGITVTATVLCYDAPPQPFND